MAIDVLGAVIDSLATHLQANVSGIAAVLRSFPDPNQVIQYPSISLTVQQPRAILRDPELVRQVDNDPDDGSTTAFYRIGSLEAPVQIDIWAQSATQRGEFQDKVISALAFQVESYASYPSYRNNTTLNLQLANYHDFLASYSMRTFRWPDTEDAAARREFRALVDVEARADIIIPRVSPKMTLLDLDWRSGTGTLEQLAELPPEVQIIFEP